MTLNRTPRDVIELAISSDRDAFDRCLRSSSAIHATYADTTRSPMARQAALDLSKAIIEAARHIRSGELDRVFAEIRLWIPVFTCACQVLSIAVPDRLDIVKRWEQVSAQG